MIAAVAAFLLALAAPADGLSGTYQTQQMEVGAMLELKADGTFRYQLDYGAVSEASEGHWRAEPGLVRLDSDPLDLALLSEIERSDAAFDGEPLTIEDGALVLRRYDTVFIFHRDEP
jgi:hypothetical protein